MGAFSARWKEANFGFVPCHANAFAENGGETRGHVRDGRVCISIEDLWGNG